MNAAALIELESKKAMRDRARTAGQTGGVGRPKQNSLEANVTPKLSEPKERTRAAVAKTSGVIEHKVRQVTHRHTLRTAKAFQRPGLARGSPGLSNSF
jgi:hypothetical protein